MEAKDFRGLAKEMVEKYWINDQEVVEVLIDEFEEWLRGMESNHRLPVNGRMLAPQATSECVYLKLVK